MKTKQKPFFIYCTNLLKYKTGITILNIGCNTLLFSFHAMLAVIIQQILNNLDRYQGDALYHARPYFIALLVCVLIRIATIMSCSYLDAKRAYYYQNRTRLNLMETFLDAPDITQIAGKSSKLFEVLEGDIPAVTFPAELLTEVTGYFFYTLIALAILLSINWQLTLFIFLPLSLAIYIVQRISEQMKERRADNRSAHEAVTGLLGDIVQAEAVIKAAGAEKAILSRYAAINGKRRRAIRNETLFNESVFIALKIAVYAGTAIIMYVSGQLISRQIFGLGDFTLFIAHLDTVADCINRIVELVTEYRKSEVSYQRICESCEGSGSTAPVLTAAADLTLSMPADQPEPKYCRTPLQSLLVNDLSYLYDGNNGFEHISFPLRPGEMMVVCGPVGCGKSTLLNVLMGLIPADCGTVTYNGRNLISLARSEYTANIAGAPQKSGCFNGSLGTNLCLDFPADPDAIQMARSVAALDKTPFTALDLEIGSQGKTLSGGQKQRLALGRVLVREPALMIVDDCISALDHQTMASILSGLREMQQQKNSSLIIATNEENFLQAADQILCMERGHTAFLGTYQEYCRNMQEPAGH